MLADQLQAERLVAGECGQQQFGRGQDGQVVVVARQLDQLRRRRLDQVEAHERHCSSPGRAHDAAWSSGAPASSLASAAGGANRPPPGAAAAPLAEPATRPLDHRQPWWSS